MGSAGEGERAGMPEASNMNRRPAILLARLLMLIALSFAAVAQPASAQSILRDAETELLLKDISRPLIEAVLETLACAINSNGAFIQVGDLPYFGIAVSFVVFQHYQAALEFAQFAEGLV